MRSLVEGTLPFHRSGELLEALLVLEAEAWSPARPPIEPSNWVLGDTRLAEYGPGDAPDSWANTSDDVWLKHPHAARLDFATAALVYEAELTVGGTAQVFLASSIFFRCEHGWTPVLRHLSPLGE